MTAATGAAPSYASQGWARFLAKWIDALFVIVLFVAIALLFRETITAWREALESLGWLAVPIASRAAIVAAFILFDAASLAAIGTSPGRALLGLKVAQVEDGRPPTFDQAMGRTIGLWGMGMALTLPIISLFTMSAAWFDLLKTGSTAWDDGSDLEVRHRAVHPLRWALAIAVFAGMMVWRLSAYLQHFAETIAEPIAPT